MHVPPGYSASIRSRQRRHRRGSALVLVLWLLGMLTVTIYTTWVVVRLDVDLSIAQKQAFRARQLTEMGLNIAMNPAVKKHDSALLKQALDDGDTFEASIRGEGGRLNINNLLQAKETEFLERLWIMWGLTNEEALMLNDRLLDWIDADQEAGTQGMEKEDYEEIGLLGYPFDRPFYNLDEMIRVPGFTEVMSHEPNWRDFFTIYSGGKLDINEAAPKVLAAARIGADAQGDPRDALPDYTEQATEWVQQFRFGPDALEFTEDDTPIQDVNKALEDLGIDPEAARLFTTNDTTVHIEVVATVGEYRKRMVVVVRNRQGTPQVLSREERSSIE